MSLFEWLTLGVLVLNTVVFGTLFIIYLIERRKWHD